MPDLSLAAGTSWVPLSDGLVVSRGDWHGVARGRAACTLRDQLTEQRELTNSSLVERLVKAQILTPGRAGGPLCGPPEAGAGDSPHLVVDERAITPIAIGPLTVPGRTGCLECWRIRRASLTRHPDEYRRLLQEGRAAPADAARKRLVTSEAAKLALRWLSGGAAEVEGAAFEIDGGQTRRHPFLPVPGCPHCGGIGAGAGRTDLEQLMLSSWTGPVAALTHRRLTGGEWSASAYGVTVDTAHGTVRRIGGEGRAGSPGTARLRALQEFAERMALTEPAVEPSHADCPLQGRTIEVVELSTGSPGQAAAQDYYLHPGTCAFGRGPGRPTTNGAAAGSDYWSALQRGVLELLERDALMLTWRWNLPRPRWEPQRPEPGADYVDLSHVHDVPTVVCVLTRTAGDRTIRTVGSAADRTAAQAARRAFNEATMVHDWLKDAEPSSGPIQEFSHHALHYLAPERSLLVRRLLPDSGPPASPSDLHENGRDLVVSLARRLKRRGISLYAADLTPPWMRAAGIHVVVARSPQLYPLELGFGSPATAERLRWRAGTQGEPLLDPVPLA